MVKQWVSLLTCVQTILHGLGWSSWLPLEDKKQTLSCGATAYVCENVLPSQAVSLRCIWKNAQENALLYSVDVDAEGLGHIEPILFDLGQRYPRDQLGIVAVGDFIEQDMSEWIEQTLTHGPADVVRCGGPTGRLIDLREVSAENIEGSSPFLAAYYAERFLSAEQPFQRINEGEPTPLGYFNELPLDGNERKLINKIITTMAEKNIFSLLLEKKSLESKGKKIEHVHPLRFLGYIFGDQNLKSCMRSIRKSHFKWSNFIDGLARRLEEESIRGNLLPYLSGFAQTVQCDAEGARGFLERRDWDGLVRFLL